jgi:hypothetical protein
VRYTVSPGYSSSEFCSSQGGDVEVSYLPDNSGGGRVITTSSQIAMLVFTWLPRIFLVLGVSIFIVRLVSIIGGAWLFVWGRRRTRSVPETDTSGLLERLHEAWGQSATATPDLNNPIASVLNINKAPPAAPSSPPPGWYHNPNGPGERWWDGTTWGEHTRTGSPPPPPPRFLHE